MGKTQQFPQQPVLFPNMLVFLWNVRLACNWAVIAAADRPICCWWLQRSRVGGGALCGSPAIGPSGALLLLGPAAAALVPLVVVAAAGISTATPLSNAGWLIARCSATSSGSRDVFFKVQESVWMPKLVANQSDKHKMMLSPFQDETKEKKLRTNTHTKGNTCNLKLCFSAAPLGLDDSWRKKPGAVAARAAHRS